jgi:pantetheine-phosphate adenylyltransferase
MIEQRLEIVSVGGTFDVMHKGHWILLEEAFVVGEKVIIGLTTDEFASSLNKPHVIDCFEKRLKDVKTFLHDNNFEHRATIVPLEDPYGPTIYNEKIEGLIVSEETEPGAEKINKIRINKGLKPLLIIVLKMILAEDGIPISSSRIRRQEVDKYGYLVG